MFYSASFYHYYHFYTIMLSMNIPINNYRKYIIGNLFAASGYVFFVMAILINIFSPFLNNDTYYEPDIAFPSAYDMSCLLIGLSMIYISAACSILSIMEFVIRKTFRCKIHQPKFKDMNPCQKKHTVLFWMGIIFSQICNLLVGIHVPLYLLFRYIKIHLSLQ